MLSPNQVEKMIRLFSRQYRVDPGAALAVASTEGGIRAGAVGDYGTSFGPFQLHVGGALPAGKGAKWANSRSGIRYAIRKLAQSGAAGKHGRAAISSIVRNFERPADPESEIAKAVSRYKTYAGSNPSIPNAQPTGFGGGGKISKQALLSFVMSNNAQFAETGTLDTANTALSLAAMMRSEREGADPGARDFKTSVGSVPRSKPKELLQAMKVAKNRFGLTIRENSKYDHVDPVHTEGSWHYQHFGGKYDWLNRAADISGSADRMAAFTKWARRRYGKRMEELFYDPLGGWDKGISTGPIGGHSDHVHIAF